MNMKSIDEFFLKMSEKFYGKGGGFHNRSSLGVFSSCAVLWLSIRQRLKDQSLKAALGSAILDAGSNPVFQRNKRSKKIKAGDISQNTGGFSRARSRMPLEEFEGFASVVTEELLKEVGRSAEPVFVLDGQVCVTASSPDNVKRYGRHKVDKRHLHYPRVRTVAAHHLYSGLALNPASGSLHDSEVALATNQILPQLPAGALVIADRLYGTRRFVYEAAKRNIKVLVRLPDKMARAITGGKLPNKRQPEVPITWTPSRYELSHKTAEPTESPVQGRVVRFVADARGFRSRSFLFFTTSDKPISEIAALYRQRVQVEVFIRHLKQTLKLFFIRAKKGDNVRKEIVIAYLTYNLLRAIMADAAKKLRIDPSKLSFTATLNLLLVFAPALLAEEDERKAKVLLQRFYKAVSQSKLPTRKKERSYPREIKLTSLAKYPQKPWARR